MAEAAPRVGAGQPGYGNRRLLRRVTTVPSARGLVRLTTILTTIGVRLNGTEWTVPNVTDRLGTY
jgi:hypothetical protein